MSEGRKKYVSETLAEMRRRALEQTMKDYAALPLAWRKAIAQEAGLDILKLSRATAAQRRELQKAVRRILTRDGMAYAGKALVILTKACEE
jgi:hypothetical protein